MKQFMMLHGQSSTYMAIDGDVARVSAAWGRHCCPNDRVSWQSGLPNLIGSSRDDDELPIEKKKSVCTSTIFVMGRVY